MELFSITRYTAADPVTLTGREFSWDSTLTNSLTWSDGTNATNTWTFAVTGQDTTMVWGDGVMTFSHNVDVTQTIIAKRGLFGGVQAP